MTKTNIERLHDVIDGKRHGRGTGKTFARCHEVAGLIELGHETIYCAMTLWKDVEYLTPMLAGVLQEHGLVMRRGDDPYHYFVVDINEQDIELARIIFEAEKIYNTFRGKEGAIVKMGHND